MTDRRYTVRPADVVRVDVNAVNAMQQRITELKEARELLQRLTNSAELVEALRKAPELIAQIKQTHAEAMAAHADAIKNFRYQAAQLPGAIQQQADAIAVLRGHARQLDDLNEAIPQLNQPQLSPGVDPVGSFTYLTNESDQITLLNDPVQVTSATYGADPTGNTPSDPAIIEAIAAAQATAESGYARSRSTSVYVPAGRYQITQKINIPEGTTIIGAGFNATMFYLPSTSFQDNAVFATAVIDFSQEYMGLQGFRLYGQGSGGTNISTTNQPNPGAAATVQIAVGGPVNATPFALTVNPIGAFSSLAAAGWPADGTLLDVTTGQRIMYQSITAPWTFANCWIVNGYGAVINIGDTINAVATDNVVGIQMMGLGAPSYLDDVFVGNMTAECVMLNSNNGLKVDNVFTDYSNRDSFLYTGYRAGDWFRNLTCQYSGQSDTGNTFACCHLQGQSAQQNFQGSLTIGGLYMEVTAHNQIGLHIDNIGNISADNIRLEGGVNTGGTSFATQVGVQIDSTQANPTLQDGEHTANILISNVSVNQIGRTALKDNVIRAGGATFATPANVNGGGVALTRYYTEDQQGASDRIRALLRGSIAASTFEPVELFQSTNLNQASTSGTQIGRTVPVLAGYSYGHVAFRIGTTAATFGTNADGHWYLAVYDQNGNLVTQTADQGTTALTASSNHNLALNAAVTPATDQMYTLVVMIYVGTGGAPVAPTLAASAPTSGTFFFTGLPQVTVTANAGQTTGTAPSTLGTIGSVNDLPIMGMYT